MTYLFDTDSFVFLLKRNAQINSRVSTVGFSDLALSVITIAEVLHGAYYSANPIKSLQETRALAANFTTIDLDGATADRFAAMKADLRRSGQIIADFDLLIGATAITAGRVLVTNNTNHFQRLGPHGLTIENWVI